MLSDLYSLGFGKRLTNRSSKEIPRHSDILIGIASALLLCATTAVAQVPGVTSILDTRDGIVDPHWSSGATAGNFIRPLINDNGIIMFSATLAGTGKWHQVYMTAADPGQVTSFNTETYGDWPLWNAYSFATTNSNTLVWLNDDTGDRRLAISPISPTDNPVFLHATANSGISGRSIGANNTGLVTYRDSSAVYIFDSANSSQGNVPRVIAVTGELNQVGSQNANDLGQVAFSLRSGEIFYHDWNANTTVQVIPGNGVSGAVVGAGLGRGVQPAINNAGTIAFVGRESGVEFGLYTMDVNGPVGAEATLVDVLSGEMYFSLSINETGQIVYLDTEINAGLPEGYVDRLRVWTGEELITILSTGDEFNGGVVSDIDVSSYSINDRGEVVFGYRLAGTDGPFGVGYYQVVPEPSALVALVMGGGILGFWRYRHRKQSR